MPQPIGSTTRLVFWGVAVLTGLTGLVMFFLPQYAGGQLWPWELTPLVSRYLGGLFIGVAVGAMLCARADDWSDVRLLFPPGLTFTGLSVVAAVIHLDRLGRSPVMTAAFFAVYALVFVAGVLTYLRYERERAGLRARGRAGLAGE